MKKKTYIDNNGIECVPKDLSRKDLPSRTTLDQRRMRKIITQGSKGQFDGEPISSRHLDLGPKTVKYSKMSDAQKVNILYNSMLNKEKREKERKRRRMSKFGQTMENAEKNENEKTLLERSQDDIQY